MTGDAELIGELLKGMESNRKLIETDIASLVFYMQGGITYNDAWLLTMDQRKIMSKVIEKHYASMNPDKKAYM
ncbi:hypothetical protein UFOVP29_276 [uncultured Caudovirales phage]|uniref:Uncharacterized protein n=1 Tax=uncultured Caudovirales phage TaxID=2100421 RepID=A0A6J5KQL7_9CAUD|nr:hypothetical protein UFOVP29_276 [uncultured Caudovirales phage]